MEFLYVIVLVAVMAAVQALVYGKLAFRGLDYDCNFTEQEVSEGDEIKLVETVSNRKLLPLPWLRSELTTSMYLDFAGSQSLIADETRFVPSFFMLRGFRRTVRSWNVRCAKRGVYEIKKCVLLATDLLGLKRMSHAADVDARLTVLPRPINLMEDLESANRLMGDVIVRRHFLDDPFYRVGVREYTPRDSMKNIHWGATARTGQLMVHEHQQTAEQNLLVLLNVQTHSYETSVVSDKGRIETAIRICAGYFDSTVQSGLPVRFAANCALEPGEGPVVTNEFSGREHVMDLFRTLARLPISACENFTIFLGGTAAALDASDIVLVTAYLNEPILAYARDRQEQGRRVKIVCPTKLAEDEIPDDLEVYGLTEEEAKE